MNTPVRVGIDAAAYAQALKPITSRVRTDVTWIRGANGVVKRTDAALTDGLLLDHIKGGMARGCCPIKAGESTTMLALLDLDSHKGEATWAEMAEAAKGLVAALQARDMRAVAWRSRGGRGIHVYLLWDEPQDAYSVRVFLKSVLTDLGYHDGTGGIKAGEVEVFPKQGHVPVDGFGNMFILPLAGESVPLDAELQSLPRESVLSLEWPSSPAVEVVERPERLPSSVLPQDLGMAGRALMAIPNDAERGGDRAWWFRVLCAFKEAAGEEGDSIALQWSEQHPSHDDAEFGATWCSIRVGKPGGAPADHLYRTAERHGFAEHMTQEATNYTAQARAALQELTLPGADLIYSPDKRESIIREQAAQLAKGEADALIKRIAEASGEPVEELQRLAVRDGEPLPLDWLTLPDEPPEVPFIIPGWLPDGVVTLFAAHGGTGKSFMSLWIALCLATGVRREKAALSSG